MHELQKEQDAREAQDELESHAALREALAGELATRAESGDLAAVLKLLSRGAPVDEFVGDRGTPLIHASKQG